MSKRILGLLLNPVSLIGCVLAVIGFGASFFALIVDLFRGSSSPYQGLLTFVLFPSVFISGLFLASAGAWLEARRRRRLERESREWQPRLDPGSRRHRRILFGIAGFAVVAVLASLVGAYHAFEFTEATEFCGELCHTPMEPQYTAYLHSPHASVGCTSCHVGPGIHGFLEAKLAGMRQLAQMVGSTYPRPIVANERKVEITSEACERCHWREHLWAPRFDGYNRFGYDLRTSKRSFHVLTNPSGSRRYVQSPAHWHAQDESITFRPADPKKQNIPWVKVVRRDGTSVVYEDAEAVAKGGASGLLPEERMECIDCHSRPAHQFPTPDESVDRALSAGRIDPSLPSIKKAAVAALAKSYPEGPAADGIRAEIERFYQSSFGGEVLARRQTLDAAIREVIAIHARSSFPEMRVDWTTHPDHSGHRESPGCFRCHGGKHVSSDGKTLASDCSLCHSFYALAPDSRNLIEMPADASSLHPFTRKSHAHVTCWTCHSGAASPYEACGSCHPEMVKGEHAMRFECSICHQPGVVRAGGKSCAPCHPVGPSKLHANAGHAECLGCHAPHAWQVATPGSCTGCHAMVAQASWQNHYPGQGCTTQACHDFRGVATQLQGLPTGPR